MAQYFWDAGWSLEELQSLMKTYQIGCEKLAADEELEAAMPMATSIDPDYGNNGYFSQKPVSSDPHYLMLITTNVNQHLNYYVRLKEDYDDPFGDDPAPGDVFSFNTDNAISLSGYQPAIMSFNNNATKTSSILTYTTQSYPTTPLAWSAFMQIPLTIGDYVGEGALTEHQLFNSISVRPSASSQTVDWDVIVYGDINHDGRADEEDLAILSNHVANDTNLCEKEEKALWAYSFARYSADTDHNGILNSNDVRLYNLFLMGTVYPYTHY